MKDYNRKEIIYKKIEFSMKSPLYAQDIELLTITVQNEIEKTGGKIYDNTISVEPRDDEIVLSYIVTTASFSGGATSDA